ncbi:MAG TPA: PQQ-binding-like beta-propeller repeat protein, partial [Pirellulales bacterium]
AKPRPTPIVSTSVLAAMDDRPAAAPISNQAVGVMRPINAMPIKVPAKFPSPGLSAHPATASPSGSTVAIFAKGTAYWVNSSDGKPCGRKFLGFDSFGPTPIEPLDQSEFIAYDARHQELTRVKAEMASVVWRQTLGAPLAGEPAIRGTTLFCSTRAGRLLAIDLDSGEIIGSVQLAEPLRASPTVSSDGSTLFLMSDRGNLLALDAKDFHSKGATRPGVNRGAVWLAPIEIGKYLLIVDNSDLDHSSLRVIASAAEGSGKTAQQISLAGQVSTPPLADGQRLFVVTDRGEVSVFAASGPPTAPLVKIAGGPPDSTADRKPRFLALQDNRLFVGGRALAAYDAVGGGNLRPLWQRLAEESVIAAPSITADSIVVAARRPGMPGVVVRSINRASGEPNWETIVGAPLAGEPLVDPDGKTLEAVHPWAGIVRQQSVGTAPQEFIAAPVVKIDGERPMPAVGAVPYGSLQVALVGVNGSGSQRPPEMRLLFADRRSGNLEASPWRRALACPPVAMAENVVVADRQGEIVLLSVSRGEPIASPFIMPMTGDSDLPSVASMAAGKSEVVVTDGRQRIYCLELKTDPSKRFVLRAEEPLTRAIASPIAMAGRLIFTDDETGEITARNIADLKPVKSCPLGSRLQWGPVVAGEMVLAATDRELVCFDSKPELIWRKPLAAGVPVGTALVQGADLVLASMTGTVWRVDRKSGEPKKSIDLGEPLASGPVPFDKHWAIAAADGSLLFIEGR